MIEVKNSGVDRIGAIPRRWNVSRLKFIASIQNGSTPKSDVDTYWDGTIRWFTPSDFKNCSSDGSLYEPARRITELGLVESGCTLVTSDSVLLTTRAPVGNVAKINGGFTFNQGCKAITPTTIDLGYLFRFMSICGELLDSLSNGTTFKELPTDRLSSVRLPIPPLEEQRLISRYLDKKTQQIDTLIEKIEKKIELLKEQRTSLINHYVTKGLDPNVEMKDSGVEWVGKIPKHWIKTPLKHLFEYKKGGRAQLLTQEYILSNPGPYPVFSGSTLSDGIGAISDYDFDYEAVIHVSTVGAAMTSQIVRGRFSLSQNCLILIPKDQISIEFLLWVIQLNFSELRKQLPKIIQPSFRYEDLDQISVYIPTSTEQLSIVEAIKNKVEFLDTLGMKESLRISLLEEYRQSLISSVVTGKVRVTEDMI